MFLWHENENSGIPKQNSYTKKDSLLTNPKSSDDEEFYLLGYIPCSPLKVDLFLVWLILLSRMNPKLTFKRLHSAISRTQKSSNATFLPCKVLLYFNPT
jgi:hypothetical protein